MTSIILLMNHYLFLPFIYILQIKLSISCCGVFFLTGEIVKYWMLDHLFSLEIEQCIQNKQTNEAMQDSSLDEKKSAWFFTKGCFYIGPLGQLNMGCYCCSRLQDSICFRHVFSPLFLRVRCRLFLRWNLCEGYFMRHNAGAARRRSLWFTGVSCC